MIWDYDVMMQGTWDLNASNVFNNNSVNIVSNYIDKGKGVLTGHDTIGAIYGKKLGTSRIADKFNIIVGVWNNSHSNGYDLNFSWGYVSTKVKINTKRFLTQFPWSLGPERYNTYSAIGTYNCKCC